MSQQKGFKRAAKVAKRAKRLGVAARKRNINKAFYQLKKQEDSHEGHDHEGHDHD